MAQKDKAGGPVWLNSHAISRTTLSILALAQRKTPWKWNPIVGWMHGGFHNITCLMSSFCSEHCQWLMCDFNWTRESAAVIITPADPLAKQCRKAVLVSDLEG
jgi:hypothetical protein